MERILTTAKSVAFLSNLVPVLCSSDLRLSKEENKNQFFYLSCLLFQREQSTLDSPSNRKLKLVQCL
jgi:hypothetical protein